MKGVFRCPETGAGWASVAFASFACCYNHCINVTSNNGSMVPSTLWFQPFPRWVFG